MVSFAAGALLLSAPAAWGLSFTTSSYDSATRSKPYYELALTEIEVDGRFDSLYESRAFYYSGRIWTNSVETLSRVPAQNTLYRSDEFQTDTVGQSPRNVISLMGTAIVFDTLEPGVSEQTAVGGSTANPQPIAVVGSNYPEAPGLGAVDDADQVLSGLGSLSPLQLPQVATRFDLQTASNAGSSPSGVAVSPEADALATQDPAQSAFPTRADGPATALDTASFDAPEPTSAAMALIGIAAICFGAWRRRPRQR